MSRILKSTGIVAASTLMSRVLGLVRDMLMASMFSATKATDAFYVAFRIPNLIRRFVSEGVLTISFIPVYTEYLITKGPDEALELSQKTITILTILLAACVLLGIVFSPQIVGIIALGFDDPSQIHNAVAMTRIMFPYLFMVSMLAFCMGVLNSHKYFFAPAFAPFLLNVGIIAGIIFLSRLFDEPLYGVACGVLIGGIIQLAIQIPYMARAGFKMRWSLDLTHPGMKRIFRLAGPGMFSMGIQQINTLVVTLLGSFLPDGSISYIYYSDRLNELVLGVFVMSIGNVILPELSELTAAGNHKKMMDLYRSAVRYALFLAIPTTVALMIVGFPIISVLFMHNNFTARDADMTYRALFYASTGIVSIAVLRITVPAFYALKDSKPPVYAAIVSFAVNVCFGLVLMRTDLRHAGLTFALAISSTVQMLILVFLLRKKVGDIGLAAIMKPVVKYCTAAAAMGVVIWLLSGLIDWRSAHVARRLMVLTGVIFAGLGAYLSLCYFMNVEEVTYLAKKIFNRKGRI